MPRSSGGWTRSPSSTAIVGAELEENRGVALRPLIGVLAANLPRDRAAQGGVHADRAGPCTSLYATQDVAVPVAFLVRDDRGGDAAHAQSAISISLRSVAPGRAVPAAMGKGLTAGQAGEDAEQLERGERVLAGLARQPAPRWNATRSKGSMAIEIAVVD